MSEMDPAEDLELTDEDLFDLRDAINLSDRELFELQEALRLENALLAQQL